MTQYRDITIGDIVSETELKRHALRIYENTLMGVPLNEKDSDGFNLYKILPINGGVSLINGKPQGTVFGADMVVAYEKPELAAKWDVGIPLKVLNYEFGTTGYFKVTDNESTAELGTGDSVGGYAIASSGKNIRYQPGQPGYAKFTIAFPLDNAHNGDYESSIGLACDACGYSIGKFVTNGVISYKFILLRKGIKELFDLNGADLSEYDLSNLTIFRIDYGYLGAASTRVWLRDEVKNIWIKVHEQHYFDRTTSITSPNLPIKWYIKNITNTNNIVLLNGSIQAGSVNGGAGIDASARPKTYKRDFSAVSATDGLIFAFRNPKISTMYSSIDYTGTITTREFKNQIDSLLVKVKGNVDGLKVVNINLYMTDIDNVTGIFTPVELGYSVLEISENSVVTDRGKLELLDSFPLTKVDKFVEFIKDEENLLPPGKTAIFEYTTASATDISVFIKFQDLF